MKVLFLINDAFGIGGTIKTTFNLGAALAARGHDVEVLSTIRRRDVPQLAVDPAIRLLALTETRPGHSDYDHQALGRDDPAELYPSADFRAADYNAYVEERYRRFLRGTDADVVIATRPGLIAYVGQFAPRRVVRIGQEHLVRGQHRRALRDLMPAYIRKLDAFVTVSAHDAEDYRAHLRPLRTRLLFIPNGVPAPGVPPSTGQAKLVVAAGRLVASKRYDVLIRAFAKVVTKRPDWQLRIYGDGREAPALRQLVLDLGLHNHVRLMGRYAPMEPEWAKGSIAAVSSDREPFGMTLVEAMRCGVPVVSTDAPHGPGEILQHGVDGLLTPVGDPDALGAALLQLISDDGLRRRMAAAALRNAERFDPAPIAARYEELFHELADRRPWWSGARPRLTDRPIRWSGAPHRLQGRARWWPGRSGLLAGVGSRQPLAVLGPVRSVTAPTLDWDGTSPLPDGVTLRPAPDRPGVFLVQDAAGTVLQAGLRDTRALVDAVAGTRIQVPFRTDQGELAVRVWDQRVYAEVGDVSADSDGVHVDGRLFGADFADPSVVARADGVARELPVTTDETAFRVTVPALSPGTWSLWLRSGATAEPVRLGRCRDDIVNKRTAFVLPMANVGEVRLQPGYTGSNEFEIRVT